MHGVDSQSPPSPPPPPPARPPRPPAPGLSWAQFQSTNQKGYPGYWWQADHTRPGQTANCFVAQLELKNQEKHTRRTQLAQLEFMYSVPKPVKRPAAAMR